LTAFGLLTVSYDAENRQTKLESNVYSYDGAGQRVGKTTANGTTSYIYDAFGQLAAEYSSATTCYLSTDHLGSTRLVTDPYASVVARHDYAPFGQEIPAGVGGRTPVWGASDNVNQKFTAKERGTDRELPNFGLWRVPRREKYSPAN
jgi:YD repeat-containing protein